MHRKQLTRSFPNYLLVLVVLVASLFSSQMAQAQITTSSILGTVTDLTGAAVQNAQVSVKDVDRNLTKTVTSNGVGMYRVDSLLAGNYSVSVTAPGFKSYVQSGIKLNAGVPLTINVELPPGAVEQSVDVTGEVPLVETTNAEIGTTVDTQAVTELPLVNRNAYTLLDLTPGVQSNTTTQSFGAPTQVTIINGGANNGGGTTNYFFDGAPNLNALNSGGGILPNPDALQEFRVQTSNYGAAYGRFPSGIINAVVRTGTNNLHGTVFEFFRNPHLNNRPWGSLPTDPKEPLHRNQFGFTLGGPIVKDKVFFFGSYGGLRQRDATLLTGAIVPSALERAGNFTQSLGTRPRDPLTGTNFVCNGVTDVICPDRIDPVALNLLNYVPQANTTVRNAPGWTGYNPSPLNQNDYLIKVNAFISPAHTISGTYFMSTGNTSAIASAAPPGSGALIAPYSDLVQTWKQQNVILNETWVISPTTVNNFWLSYTRMRNTRTDTPTKSLADLGSTFTPQGAPGLPNITVTGFFNMRNQNAGPATTDDYALRDLVSLTHGKHTLQFGGEFLMDKASKAAYLNNYGMMTFSGVMTRNALADFLIGIPASFQQDSPAYTRTTTFTYAGFVQDDFRATRQLTINLGLRYDVQTPPVESADHLSTYVPGQQSTRFPSAPLGVVFPGDEGIPRGIAPVKYGHISPRVGFALDPFGDGKTAIRAGAGLYWGSVSEELWATSGNGYPFALQYTAPNTSSLTGATLSDPYRGTTNPFPNTGSVFPFGARVGAMDRDAQWPETVQVNMSIQQQITRDLAATVAFVGAYSRHQLLGIDVNYPSFNTNYAAPLGLAQCGTSATIVPTASNSQCRRPIQPMGAFAVAQTRFNTSYNALQVSATKRMSRHFSASGYYTWSKALSDVPLQGGVPGASIQNLNNLAAERSRTANDFTHQATIAIIWQPGLTTQNRVLGALLNGWEFAPIARFRTGAPLTVLNGIDANLDGAAGDRAKLIGDPFSGTQSITQWFNTAAFARNPAVAGSPVDGNSPQNFINAPGYRSVDLTLARTFAIHENIKFQFRAEASNALNIASYSAPGTTVGTGSFGVITGASPMRQIQLGGKITF